MPAVFLSVVIPAYNEAQGIAQSLRKIHDFLQNKSYTYEIIISNDGSTDRTLAAVEEYAAAYPDASIRCVGSSQNEGKGAAVRRGVLASQGEFVLITDADLSTPIKETDKLLAELQHGADVSLGSRYKRKAGCDVQQSLKRRLSGRVFNFLVQTIFLPGYSDTQCGFKCFRGEAARSIFKEQKFDGFSFDVEAIYLAQKKNLKIVDVPIMWREGSVSRVKLLRDSSRMLNDLFKLRKLYGRSVKH